MLLRWHRTCDHNTWLDFCRRGGKEYFKNETSLGMLLKGSRDWSGVGRGTEATETSCEDEKRV